MEFAYSVDMGGGKSSCGVADDLSPTLATTHGGEPAVCYGVTPTDTDTVFAAGFCTEHSEKSRSIGYEEEKSPTLRAGVTPAVVGVDMYNGATTGEVSSTVQSARADPHHLPCVVGIENHPADSRVKLLSDDTRQTLSTRMGTGGGNVPMAMETTMWDGSDTVPTLTKNNAGGNQRMPDKDNFNAVIEPQLASGESVSGCLNAAGYEKLGAKEMMSGNYSVLQPEAQYSMTTDSYTQVNCEKAPTLKARDYKDPPVVNGPINTVRRLTPTECESLQGFPRGWTDIGDWTDSKGKVHHTADNSRYAALGNSIALPFWRQLVGRMAEYLPEGATLGSLFSGIGGFDLVWEETYGVGASSWTSEIEEFPIAVLKRHFGDSETNKEGDWWTYLKKSEGTVDCTE